MKYLEKWCKIAGVLNSLKDARIGLMGHALEAMYDMHADPTAVSAAFGLHVPLLEIDDVLEVYKTVTEEEIAEKIRVIDEELPVIMLHRHDNAYILSSFLRSTTVKTKIKTPLGAPILDGYDALIEDGYASYNFPKAERRECRVFVEQESGIVSCHEDAPVSFQIRRRITVKGLKNATVRFLAEEYCKDNIEAKLNSHRDFFFVGDDFDGGYVTKDGITYFEARNVTGTITFGMPDNKK